ncbi:lysophospholipase [Wolfiporia cocos MD-104 SS10]|uniref:Lysophospholipase n=1 Tax=Wolfiporia cocos (strain MD-104) TaxID=742152 RepID=A0A2H3IWP6_WOLCO|nr:lysophospholipase [Wolfiporia cocos MD-104 SS10]
MVVLFPAVDAVSKAASSSQIATYAPVYETCPAANLIRRAGTPQTKNQTLDPNEVSYVASRRKLAKSSLQKWLGKNASAVYSGKIDELSDDDIPKLAVSLSGGNFRAAMFNVAALEAFDDRNSTSVSNGLGGLLQSSTYMTALSGGSYVSTSMMFNGFPRPSDLVFGNSAAGLPGWQLDQSLFEPGPSGEYTSAFEHDIFYDLGAKRSAGNFPVTFCDLWGRALAYHFLPGTSNVSSFATNATAGNHAASLTYSSATNLGIWQNHTMPFPIVLIDVNSPNVHGEPFGDTGSIPLTSVVYELTPYEFGSYDPQLAAFVPTQYLGSTFKGGYQETCVNKFDNAGLMVGTSSCDFNIYNVTDNPAWTSPDGFQPLIAEINETFYQYQPGQEMDVTGVTNPFYQINVGTYQDANETALSLMDGSLDVENDPILPLLNKKRAVDVVVVLDSSGETSYTKPDGLSLLATQEKAKILPEGTVNFPKPFPNTTDEFMSLGLNARPVFFGCDGPTNAEDAYP